MQGMYLRKIVAQPKFCLNPAKNAGCQQEHPVLKINEGVINTTLDGKKLR